MIEAMIFQVRDGEDDTVDIVLFYEDADGSVTEDKTIELTYADACELANQITDITGDWEDDD